MPLSGRLRLYFHTLDWVGKGLAGTNTLAYLEHSSLTAIKSFCNTVTEEMGLKIFYFRSSYFLNLIFFFMALPCIYSYLRGGRRKRF
jgi:hypothetical protein